MKSRTRDASPVFSLTCGCPFDFGDLLAFWPLRWSWRLVRSSRLCRSRERRGCDDSLSRARRQQDLNGVLVYPSLFSFFFHFLGQT
jgi:hypothetical protein